VASKGKLLIRVAKIGQFKSTIMAVQIQGDSNMTGTDLCVNST
jgi:hypothetical protein